MDNGNEIATKETFSIVGGNLILDSSSKSSWGDMKEKMAFDKQ